MRTGSAGLVEYAYQEDVMSQATNGSNDASIRELDVIVVGAGFSGRYMLYQLRNQMGLNTRVYEAGDGVGGT